MFVDRVVLVVFWDFTLYRAFLYNGFLSEEECDHLITLVRQDLIFLILFVCVFSFLKIFY